MVCHFAIEISLNDSDLCFACTYHNAYVVGPIGAIACILAAGGIENDVAGQGNVGIILLSAADLIEKADLSLTATFGGDNVRETALDGHGADKRGAPLIGVLNLVTLRQGFMTVI